MDFVCAPLMCLMSWSLREKVFPQKRQGESSTGRSDFSGAITDGGEVTDDDEVTDGGGVTEVEDVSGN